MITLDTSAIFALLNRRDPDHEQIRTALLLDRGPYFIPAGILAEIAYLVEQRLGQRVLALFLADLESGAYTLDCGESDVKRVIELVERYADLPLGYSDAAVIACAERFDGQVMTLDRRDFGVVAREGKISVIPGGAAPGRRKRK